jgi:hypothetical protein
MVAGSGCTYCRRFQTVKLSNERLDYGSEDLLVHIKLMGNIQLRIIVPKPPETEKQVPGLGVAGGPFIGESTPNVSASLGACPIVGLEETLLDAGLASLPSLALCEAKAQFKEVPGRRGGCHGRVVCVD